MKTLYSDQDEVFIRDNYPKLGAARCAAVLGKTQKQVRCKAQKMSIQLDFTTRSRIIKEWKRKKVKPNESYSVNPSLFYNVETSEIAYLLGFLWADGYVYRNGGRNVIGLGIEKNDFDNHIKPVLMRSGKWNMFYYQQKGRKEQGRARISNKPLSLYLENNGYRSKSNSACSIISTIPENLKHYWFRGLVDGDGCIYYSRKSSRVSIHSEYDQNWVYMNNVCSKLNIGGSIVRKTSATGNRSQFKITSKSYMLKFLDWVYEGYPDDGIGFKRKYDKYIQIKQSYVPPSSKYRGLSKTPSNTWQVRKWISGENVYLGTFKTEDEAKLAYDKKQYI